MGPLVRFILLVIAVAIPLATSQPAGTGNGDVPGWTDGLLAIRNLIESEGKPAGDIPETVTIANTGVHGLHCRSAPDVGSTLIRILFDGETVPVRGPVVDGWLPVVCAGQDGWIKAENAKARLCRAGPSMCL
jgi:hypothetical protein